MKTSFWMACALVVAAAVWTGFVYAEGAKPETPTAPAANSTPACGGQFVDADGDGVCDNKTAQCGKGNGACKGKRAFVDADGDGVCDNKGAQCGKGNGACKGKRAFVDADGDGVCDNKAQCTKDGKACTGQGAGKCGRFVDANGDGVCDLKGEGKCKQNGQGMGARCGQGRCAR